MSLRKWKTKQLADAAGISLGTLYQFMAGRDDEKTAKAISKALKIEL